MTASPRRRLGFFDGALSFLGGLGFIVGRPSVWGWALVPMVIATVLFLGFGALAFWAGSALAHRMLWDPGDGTWTTVAMWALKIVLWIVGAVVSFLLAFSLAQPLSGFALDEIARKQELALGGRTWPDQPFVPSALRALRITLSALAVSLPILAVLTLISLLFPPATVVTVPLKFVVTGLTIAYDFLDYPLGLRGAGVRARAVFVREHFPAVLGFGLAAAVVLLIPGVGLLLLPAGVAGATRMIVEAERTR